MNYIERPNISTQHRTKLEQLHQNADELYHAAQLIAVKAQEVLDKGGGLDIQQQMSFITSLYARMSKDWGIVEHLQHIGSYVRRKPKP